MHKIKQIPEDFVVKEVSELKLGANGNYSYFLLKKRGYNTLRAVKMISEKLGIPEKNIGFSGNKDKNAITEQLISIKNGDRNIEKINLKGIELEYLGKGDEEIYLGSHKGNEFMITVRNLANEEIKSIETKVKNSQILMPNYFGAQRFSKNNAEIGKSIITKGFKRAVELIVESNSDFKNEMLEHLEKRPNDYVVALKIIPLKLLKLYIHSYQSLIFNKTLEQLIKNNKKNPITGNINKNYNYISGKKLKNIGYNAKNPDNGNKKIWNIEKIPIIGFGTELQNDGIKKTIDRIMEKENIGIRDFIIRQIPELSAEGSERAAFIKINDFKIIKKDKDELNKNKEKIIVKFSLPKGCYATVLVENLFD